MGEPRDGEVFPVFRSAPRATPLSMAETLQRSAALDRLLTAPLAQGSKTMPINPTSLAERIRDVRRKRDERFAAIERDHMARVDVAAKRQDDALDRLEHKLANDAEVNEAEVRALEDEVNQLTNGGPA